MTGQKDVLIVADCDGPVSKKHSVQTNVPMEVYEKYEIPFPE